MDSLLELLVECSKVNNDLERKALIRASFGSTHRTIQQQFVKLVIIPISQKLDEDYECGNYDLRNEASCKLAHEMLKGRDLYLPYI